MMLYPAMNELLEQVPSRYMLVNVVAARARQIASRAESQEYMLEDKPVSIAIREIAQGHTEESPFLVTEHPDCGSEEGTEERRDFFQPAD